MNAVRLTVLALAITLANVAAHAESVRLPETGDPAFTVDLPEGWTHELISGGRLRAFSASHTASLTLSFLETDSPLEAIAAGALSSSDGMPPAMAGAATISGYSGSAFDGALVNSDGLHVKVHLVIVRLDDEHVAAATLLTADNLDAAQIEADMAVLKTLALTHPAPPPEAAPATPPPPAPTPEPAPTPKP